MPPKRNNRNKGRQGDQPSHKEESEEQPQSFQPKGGEEYRHQPPPRSAEGIRDQPQGYQQRGAQGFQDQPRYQQRDEHSFQGQQGKGQGVQGQYEREDQGFQGQQGKGGQGFQGQQDRGGQGFQGRQDRGGQGFQGQQDRGAQGFQGKQGKGGQGFQGQQDRGAQGFQGRQDRGGQGFQEQQDRGAQGFQGQHDRGAQGFQGQQDRGAQGFQGQQGKGGQGQQDRGGSGFQGQQGKGGQGYKGPQQRGAEIYEDQPQQPSPRGGEEYNVPEKQYHQQGQRLGAEMYTQPQQPSGQRIEEAYKKPPASQRGWTAGQEQAALPYETPPHSGDAAKRPAQAIPAKPMKDAIEQLPPQIASMSLEETAKDVQIPTGDTPKPKSDSPPVGSSAASSSALPTTKRTLLKLNINISQTVKQKFLPKRPDDGGKKGREIALIINCLDMKINPMKIYMYDIELTKAEVVIANKKRDIKMKIERKETLRNVVYGFLKDKGGIPVFDGGKIIFTNQMLPINNDIVNKIEFKFIVDDEQVTCHFNLQRVKEENIDLSDLSHYVESGKGRSDLLPQEALRALDTIMKEMFLDKNLISINRRAIFDPKTTKPLRCGPYLLLEGYATTVRPHMWKVRFNFDKTQIVIHKPMNLYEYISELTGGFRNFRPDIIKKKISLLRVEASHLKNAEGKSYTRKYTIHGFSKGTAKTEMIEEKKMSIEQYFLKEYNIKLKYPQLELIKVNPSKKTYVPMELLQVLPNQKVLANDPMIVQEVIRAAAIPAFDRLKILREAVRTLNFGDRANKFIKNYMIEIDDKLINLNGRILEGPQAQFGGKTEALRGGKWDLRNKKFFQPHPHKVNWALFAVGTERDYNRNEQPLYDIEQMLPGAAGRVGVTMEKMFLFQYILWNRIEIELPNIINQSEKEKKRLDMLVFVINRDEDYKAVKKFGDMTFGIVTQCMKYATLQRQKGLDQYLGNIMLKINTKLGGINWELMALINKSFSPIKGRFMVFGMDVTHPSSTRNDLCKSIAAMVGSLDNTASLYSAVIRQQMTKEERSIVEVILDTKEMVYKLLMNFYQSNKTLKPDHLIFYRDGVSEGQFEIVFHHEIVAIQDACQQLEKGYQPKITYIVVQKRHKIRFFPQNERDAIGRSQNVPSGTVVDKNITHCREFDFYLCSHEGIQGTSKPAHYHVLYDENNFGSDDLQSFTYFLCHVYARSTRSVSYPAPTYYAHLAAFRGRALIGELFDDSSSSASGQTHRTTDSKDSEIAIHDYHNNKLFFI